MSASSVARELVMSAVDILSLGNVVVATATMEIACLCLTLALDM